MGSLSVWLSPQFILGMLVEIDEGRQTDCWYDCASMLKEVVEIAHHSTKTLVNTGRSSSRRGWQ